LGSIPKDYHLVKAHVAGGEAWELWWPLDRVTQARQVEE
jgi:hypothetical protein